jgi:hypothetical protein
MICLILYVHIARFQWEKIIRFSFVVCFSFTLPETQILQNLFKDVRPTFALTLKRWNDLIIVRIV